MGDAVVAPVGAIDADRVIVSPSVSTGDATIRVAADRIVEVSRAGARLRPTRCPRDGGAVPGSWRVTIPQGVVLPGLVNAHAHLDLSGLEPPDSGGSSGGGAPGFVTWLCALVARRARLDEEQQRRAVIEGIERSIRAGTTSIGDIDSFGISGQILSGSGLHGVAYREALGLDDEAIVRARELLAGWEALAWEAGTRLRRGFSPHAPYSCSRELIGLADHLARHRSWPVAIHAVETSEERAWLQEGRGALGELLQILFAPRGTVRSPSRSSVDLLSSSAFLGSGRTLIHANFVTSDEIDLIARSGSPVVYCPRSHAFFGHPAHPVAAMRRRGIPVGLGSDSVASGGSLSMLDEMVTLRRRRPDLEPDQILEMATRGGHRALGSPHPGELVAGAPADLIGLRGPQPLPRQHRELLEWLLSGEARVVFCMVAGRILARSPEPVVFLSHQGGGDSPGPEGVSGGPLAGSGWLDLPLILG